jgi:outer membrane receptor protein involved in Fe transport
VPPIQGAVLALERVSGGTQRSSGAFAQDIIRAADALTVTLSARIDHWRNYDAHNLETTVPSGTATDNSRLLPDRHDTVVNPRAALNYHLAPRVNVWGSMGRGFRAPTLNELYRQFRVGTVLTLPNDQLGPERLLGGEAGIELLPAASVTVRSTWFDDRISNPVSNVTLSTVGATVTQQRQNLGRTHVRGLQNDVDIRLGAALRLRAAYVFDRGTVTAFAANPSLVGKVIPQVPRHRGSLQLAYANARIATLSLGLQLVGRQFDTIRTSGSCREKRHRACPAIRWWISPRRARWRATSRYSPGCKTPSTRNTSSALCPRQSDPRGSRTSACASASQGVRNAPPTFLYDLSTRRPIASV